MTQMFFFFFWGGETPVTHRGSLSLLLASDNVHATSRSSSTQLRKVLLNSTKIETILTELIIHNVLFLTHMMYYNCNYMKIKNNLAQRFAYLKLTTQALS